ncbi:MAG: hypothetical protein R3A79_13575 [Nannocystaceae bacterium]
MEVHEGQGFGWSLPLRGRAPEEIARELDGIRRQVDGLIDVYFPAADGYVRTAAEAGTHGGFEGLGVVIDRGDFRAELAFECVSPRDPGAPAWVRLCGRSESRALVRARNLGLGAGETLRWVMGAVGLGVFAAMLSLLLIVPPHFSVETLFVLGGLLMVVVAVLTLVSAVSVGAWLGERVAELLMSRATRQIAGDPGLAKDFLRWRSLTRQMMAKRSLLAGDLRRLPFRHERETWSAGNDRAFLAATTV